jgi:hypothetical protein
VSEPIVDLKSMSSALNNDPEYSRETRYFTGLIKIEIDNVAQILSYDNGKLKDITSGDTKDENCKIVVRGDKDTWLNMLQLKPKPFYQCMQSTAVKHDLYMNVSNETFAYLPALNRLMQMMRAEFNKGSN